jgi:hypothetical protein
VKKYLILIAILVLVALSGICYGADSKITALTEDTAPTSDDLLVTVDAPGGSAATKKATIANVFKWALVPGGSSNIQNWTGNYAFNATLTNTTTVTFPTTGTLISLSGTMTDEQLVCGENTDGVDRIKSCGAKTTINATASNFLYMDSDGHVENATTTGSGTTMVLSTGPAITQAEVLIDCNGSADPYSYCTSANASTLLAANVSRTLINSYGRGEAQTVTLPAAAAGYTFIALVGTQHNSAWKIQRAGSDTITWSSGGTDTTGKTYFQETNQAVGSRVTCITYKTGASAYTWLCGSVTGTWVTD